MKNILRFAVVVRLGLAFWLIGQSLCAAQTPRDFTNISPSDLGIQPAPEKKDAETGFVMAGRNSTDVVRQITRLNGQPIADLEELMRPGANSTKGFLGRDEKLVSLLVEDNQFVVDQLKLTHQVLAGHLHVLGELAFRHQGQTILYHGRRFKLGGATFRGFVESPFEDGTRTNREASVENLENGKKLKYSLIVPHMIERYGFYEGHGTPFRVDPRDIVALLDFLPVKGEKQSKQPAKK